MEKRTGDENSAPSNSVGDSVGDIVTISNDWVTEYELTLNTADCNDTAIAAAIITAARNNLNSNMISENKLARKYLDKQETK